MTAVEDSMKVITLPKPKFGRGGTIQAALLKRRTVREIGDKKLSLQVLSNLLWSSCGVNRTKGPFGVPGITAASASNSQEIDLYVALESGIYFYERSHHRLEPVAEGDFRVLALGKAQGTAGAKAPVRLIYVVDVDRFSKAGYQEPGLKKPETQKAYYYVDTGLIAGNVYLFAASHGLAAWFHNCNKTALSKILKLRSDQHVLFGQTIGYEIKTQRRKGRS
jgi:hypothetical protein